MKQCSGKRKMFGMNVSIRAASPEDAQTIVEILDAGWKAAYVGIVPQAYLDGLNGGRRERMRNDISAGKMKALLLFEDGVPAGTVGYGKSRDKILADWGEVVCLYIRPGFCRRGYGERLLRAAVDDLAGGGFRDCFLWVLEDNKDAREFYSAVGFQKTDGVTHSEIMGKQLTELRYCFSVK